MLGTMTDNDYLDTPLARGDRGDRDRAGRTVRALTLTTGALAVVGAGALGVTLAGGMQSTSASATHSVATTTGAAQTLSDDESGDEGASRTSTSTATSSGTAPAATTQQPVTHSGAS